jgi:hypothetical protein
MNFSKSDLQAAYVFLKKVAFRNDNRLPSVKNVKLFAKPIEHHGYHDFIQGVHNIWVDTTDTHSFDHMLKILAHEMAHIVTFKHANWSGDPHDAQFVALARVIEVDMGWPKGSV